MPSFLLSITATIGLPITFERQQMNKTGLIKSSSMELQCLQLICFFISRMNVSVIDHWLLNGMHFARTSDEILKRMDKNWPSIKPIMESIYGGQAVKWTENILHYLCRTL